MYTKKIRDKMRYLVLILGPMLILTSGGCKTKTTSSLSISAEGDVFVKGVRQSYLSSGFDLLSDGCAVRVAGGGMKFFSARENFLKEEAFILPESPVTKSPREIENVFRNLRGTFVVTPVGVYSIYSDKQPILMGTKGILSGTRYKSYFERTDKKKKVHQYIGTTFNGLYTKTLESDTWTNLSKGLPGEQYAGSYKFYEGIDTIFDLNGMLVCLSRPVGKILHFDEAQKSWKVCPTLNATSNIEKVAFNYFKDNPEVPDLFISGNQSVYGVYVDGDKKQVKKLMNWGNETALKQGSIVSYAPILNNNPDRQAVSVFKRRTGTTIPEIRSLYINLDTLTPEKQKVINTLLKDGRFNGVIINFKDDTGRVNYASKVSLAKKINAVRPHARLKDFMKSIEPYSPYITARVVVFKDLYLQRYNSGQYAIWNPIKKAPWRINNFEHWVDPFNKDVVDYNIEIAKEIAELSKELKINEIQFDYARLPADNNFFASAVCRSQQKGWTRYDMMENFFSRVYREVDFHVSVDIYGYNAIYQMGNIIGQDARLISRYIPTICPMYYPSHFGSMYLANKKKSQEYETVNFGTIRANYWVYNGTSVRPYIQAFRYKSKYYGKKYVQDQVRGVRDGQGTGFSMWNVVSDYKDLLSFLPESFLFPHREKNTQSSQK